MLESNLTKFSANKSKKARKSEEYVVLLIPENPYLFGVERRCEGGEKFLTGDKEGIYGVHYTGICHLVSPFWDFEDNCEGESCTCLYWRTRRRQCIHLKKFYELNAHLKKPNLDNDCTVNLLSWCRQWTKKHLCIHPNDQEPMARLLRKKLKEIYLQELHKKVTFSPDPEWLKTQSQTIENQLKNALDLWKRNSG